MQSVNPLESLILAPLTERLDSVDLPSTPLVGSPKPLALPVLGSYLLLAGG